jgi:uncharacterized membrane protein
MDSRPLGQPGGSLPSAATADDCGGTSLGISAPLAAGLSYLPPVGPFVFFREKDNAFVRFHAAQATLIDVAFVVLVIVRAAVFAVLDRAQSLAALFLGQGVACVFGLVTLAFAGLWLWGLISGFTGHYTKLPLVGELAETLADGLGHL